MWQVGVAGCLCHGRCQGSLLAQGGGRKLTVSSLRFLLRAGPNGVFASGRASGLGYEAGWCLVFAA